MATVMVAEILADRDDYGSKAFSGLLGVLSVLLLGWPTGVAVALGAVAFGDVVVRSTPARTSAWWAALLAALLTAGAWNAGVAGTVLPGPWAPRAVASVSFGIFAAWTLYQASRRAAMPVAIGLSILAIIGAVLAAPAWMPHVPATVAPWADAGMLGVGVVAAFMLADVLLSSAAAWAVSGRRAPLFWLEHMPVLFYRYLTQGVSAGLIAYWYATSGAAVLVVLLAGMVAAQSFYLAYRRASATAESAIAALSSAIDARDPYTAGHSTRVAEYATRIALHLGWSKAKVERTRQAALLHDIGKLGVADHVLHKPAKLDADEFEHMKRHASVGEEIVSHVRGLEIVAAIVGQDHEHWSGGGYPLGLVGRQILPEARLIAIADVYDAMTTARPYRGALPERDVLCHLEAEAGAQLDPLLTAAFVRVVREGTAAGVTFCYCATH